MLLTLGSQKHFLAEIGGNIGVDYPPSNNGLKPLGPFTPQDTQKAIISIGMEAERLNTFVSITNLLGA